MKTAGIILAAGKGSRFGAKDHNKVAVEYHGSSPVRKGVDTLMSLVDDVYVVVGHESSSVRSALEGCDVTYVLQEELNGTGHAVQVALDDMTTEYDHVLIGLGDHMMFYTPESLKNVLDTHIAEGAVATCVSSTHDDVAEFGFGRIVRNIAGDFIAIVEQKDATPEQMDITEFNSGFIICDFPFLQDAIQELDSNNAQKELYLTSIFEIALEKGEKIIAVPLPFEQVGIGINSPEDYKRSLELFKELHD